MVNSGPDNAAPCGTLALQCFGAVILQNTYYSHMSEGQQTPNTGNRCAAAFWVGNSNENSLYVAGSGDTMIWDYQMKSTGNTGTFYTTDIGSFNYNSYFMYNIKYPGGCPVVSWNSSGLDSDAVLWVEFNDGTAGDHAQFVAFPAVPYLGSLGTMPLFKDTMNGPAPAKFTEPTIANGHAFLAGYDYSHYSSCASIYSSGVCYGEVVAWHP